MYDVDCDGDEECYHVLHTVEEWPQYGEGFYERWGYDFGKEE